MIESTNKYRNRDKDKELEEEIKELTNQATPPAPEPVAATPEEETWKKRYGDLRKHQQSVENTLKQEIDNLRKQVNEAAKAKIEPPKTKEEIIEWAKEYPDIAAIFKTMAMEESQAVKADIEEKIKALQEVEIKQRRKTAYQELLDYHPDFGKIKDSKEFHEWIEHQPKWIEDALYVNETDAYLAARAVDLYKADLEKQRKVKDAPKREAETREDAARSMRSNSAPDLGSGPKKWLESEVDKMSSREYAKYAKEIDEAMASGNFIYDISGAAR